MLQLHEKTAKKRPLWLVDPQYKIGADASNEIHIDDAGVDTLHAKLDVDGDNVVITDIAQSLDILVNGKKISEPTVLSHGDTLELSTYVFDVLDPKKRASAPVVTATEESKEENAWRLKPLNTALQGQTFVIEKQTILGRSKECDIKLVVAHLSRKHAQLTIKPEGLEVKDLGSANGTFVNKVKVSEKLLKHNDELSFDTLKFKVLAPKYLVGAVSSDSLDESPEDLDKTTMRPAISSSILHKEAKKTGAVSAEPPQTAAGAKAARPRSQQELEPESIKAERTFEAQPESKNTIVKVFLGFIIVAAGVAAYMFFG